jgi:hypothetical protein
MRPTIQGIFGHVQHAILCSVDAGVEEAQLTSQQMEFCESLVVLVDAFLSRVVVIVLEIWEDILGFGSNGIDLVNGELFHSVEVEVKTLKFWHV